jgi:rod shape determining protein RodA
MVEHFDWPLLGCTLVILMIGLANLYSATVESHVGRYTRAQSLWIGIGMLVIIFLLFPDYRILERLSYPIYFVSLFLLFLVLIKGRTALGAQRWLQLGPLSIQPSELIKPAMVMVLAKYLYSRRDQRPMGFGGMILPGLIAGVPMALILKQPDLGTSIIVGVIAAVMILFAGVQKKVLFTLLIIGMVAVPLVWQFGLHQYQKDRVYTFLSPEKDAKGKGYQTIQSRIAIGSGQLIGKGYLKGTQTKLQFLPKQHTDFAYSSFAEEFGFFGSIVIIFLYASLIFLSVNVAQTARERFGMMMALGMATLIGSQVWINLGMEMGMLPVVGVPLPLFSYGGTSLLSTMLAIGVLLNISMRRYVF